MSCPLKCRVGATRYIRETRMLANGWASLVDCYPKVKSKAWTPGEKVRVRSPDCTDDPENSV